MPPPIARRLVDRPGRGPLDLVRIRSPAFIISRKAESLSWLGGSSGPSSRTANGDGWYQHFQNGSIFWSPRTGAWEVHGAIRDKWASLGWERSFLGFPTTDETGTLDGSGRFNHFQHGSIFWSPRTGAWEVHGAIRDKWASLGWERSFLGYPVSDEMDLPGRPGARANNFEHGQIAWAPEFGASVSATTYTPGGGGGLQPLGLGAGGTPEVRRIVVLSAYMAITDHESIAANEHGTASSPALEYVVTNGMPQETLSLIGRAGGEVRVELTLSAQVKSNGDVTIAGKAELYEGTSTETDDLDGTTDISFLVPRDGFVSKTYQVRNLDEGGDFADIRLTASNSAV